jgi:hypothetical protein
MVCLNKWVKQAKWIVYLADYPQCPRTLKRYSVTFQIESRIAGMSSSPNRVLSSKPTAPKLSASARAASSCSRLDRDMATLSSRIAEAGILRTPVQPQTHPACAGQEGLRQVSWQWPLAVLLLAAPTGGYYAFSPTYFVSGGAFLTGVGLGTSLIGFGLLVFGRVAIAHIAKIVGPVH